MTTPVVLGMTRSPAETCFFVNGTRIITLQPTFPRTPLTRRKPVTLSLNSFPNAVLKFRRAESHLKAMNEALENYWRTSKWSIEESIDPQTREVIVSILRNL